MIEKANGAELARIISDSVNSYSFDTKGFINQMMNEHRTLQQSFTRICMSWIYALAETPYYDERNEESVMVARQIKEALGEDGYYLPLV